MIGRGRAPGKAILAGEHFVVHGAPALAVPLRAVGKEIVLHAADSRLEPVLPGVTIEDPYPDHKGLKQMVDRLKTQLGLSASLRLSVTVQSTLPPGAHLGSSASLAVALTRAFGEAFSFDLSLEDVIRVSFDLEKLVHRDPSGVDNTVIAYDRPIVFQRGSPPSDVLPAGDKARVEIVVADSGEPSETARAIASVRRFATEHPRRFGELKEEVASLVPRASSALSKGETEGLGLAMKRNQDLLREVGVSTQGLDALLAAAAAGGALGAKITGAGAGGCIVALPATGAAAQLAAHLEKAGARKTWTAPLFPR